MRENIKEELCEGLGVVHGCGAKMWGSCAEMECVCSWRFLFAPTIDVQEPIFLYLRHNPRQRQDVLSTKGPIQILCYLVLRKNMTSHPHHEAPSKCGHRLQTKASRSLSLALNIIKYGRARKRHGAKWYLLFSSIPQCFYSGSAVRHICQFPIIPTLRRNLLRYG